MEMIVNTSKYFVVWSYSFETTTSRRIILMTKASEQALNVLMQSKINSNKISLKKETNVKKHLKKRCEEGTGRYQKLVIKFA